MSPHRFDVSNRRNGVATVTRVASNVFREPKALQPIDVDVDVLAGFRQRVEAPGSQSEVDAERQPGVLLAEFVVDHPDDLVLVADNRFDPKAQIPIEVLGDSLGRLRELGFVQERNATKDPLVGRTRKWHWPGTGDTGAAR